MADEGFRRYIGGGRVQPDDLGQVDYCADGITSSIHGDGGGRPMFEFLPAGDEPGTDMMERP